MLYQLIFCIFIHIMSIIKQHLNQFFKAQNDAKTPRSLSNIFEIVRKVKITGLKIHDHINKSILK